MASGGQSGHCDSRVLLDESALEEERGEKQAKAFAEILKELRQMC